MSGSWREGRKGPRAMQEIGWHFSSFLLDLHIPFSFLHNFPHSVIFLYTCPFFMYLSASFCPTKFVTISYTLFISPHSLFLFHLSSVIPIPLSSLLPPPYHCRISAISSSSTFFLSTQPHPNFPDLFLLLLIHFSLLLSSSIPCSCSPTSPHTLLTILTQISSPLHLSLLIYLYPFP